jgi:hypothetical protein
MLKLFRLLVATGMQVGDEVIDFRCLQNVAEGRHLATTLCDLSADLSFVQGAAYSGQIGASFAALTVDGVTVLAAVVDEHGGSVLLCGLPKCRETKRGCHNNN